MTGLRFIDIDGKRRLWRDVVALCREQENAHTQALLPVLFEIRQWLPATGRTVAGAVS